MLLLIGLEVNFFLYAHQFMSMELRMRKTAYLFICIIKMSRLLD